MLLLACGEVKVPCVVRVLAQVNQSKWGRPWPKFTRLPRKGRYLTYFMPTLPTPQTTSSHLYALEWTGQAHSLSKQRICSPLGEHVSLIPSEHSSYLCVHLLEKHHFYPAWTMPTILISGAANGLGEAFLRAYQDEPDTNILAIDYKAFESPRHNVQSFQVDVSSQESITAFASNLTKSIDLFIHCAGVRGLVPEVEQSKPDDVAACETLAIMNAATMLRTFEINTLGTWMLIRAILPNLHTNAKVIVMSSRMGSIGNNHHPNKDAGSAYAYRASKAALNTIVRSFAADVPHVNFILCHPGRVETKLVKCKEEGAISADESVAAMLPLIARWDKNSSGQFYDRFGDTIQW